MTYVKYCFADSDGSEFYAITSSSDLIEKTRAELSLPLDKRTLHINGAIDRGDGAHNQPWNWHFRPDSWDLVQISIELCDGTCKLVENDIDYWVDQVGSFCPWASRVIAELTVDDHLIAKEKFCR